MQKHFFALLLAVFLAFSLTPSAKAEEAPDVQPEQFEQPESVDLGEADEPEEYFVGMGWTNGGTLELLNEEQGHAAEGEEVFFRVAADEGYRIAIFYVANAYIAPEGYAEAYENSELAVTDYGNGTYSFIMPGNVVKIYVEFWEEQDSADTYFVCRSWTQGGKPEFVNADQEFAAEDEEVFFYIDLEEGFTIDSIRVSNACYDEEGIFVTLQDSYLDVTAHEDGTYSFIMPGNPVEIFVESSGEYTLPDGFFIGNSVQFGDFEFVNDINWFATEGTEVIFRINPYEGWEVDRVEIVNCIENAEGILEPIEGSFTEVTENADGTYSFIMPGNPVIVYAAFDGGQEWYEDEGYFICRSWTSGGTLEFVNGRDYAEAGEEVVFSAVAEEGYTLESLRVFNGYLDEEGCINPNEDSNVEYTDNGDGTYSFIMPDNPVYIDAVYSDGQNGDDTYFVCRSWTNGGTLEFLDEEQSYAEAGEEVFFSVTVDDGFTLGFIRVSNGFLDENGYLSPIEDSELEVIEHADGTYSFIMPDNPVYVYVEFFGEGYGLPDGYFVGNCVEFGEFEFVNDIDWFATEGTEVIFRINAYEGYVLDRVEVLNCIVTEDGIIEPVEGSLTEVTENADGTYSFVMPANPVIINAVMYEAPIGNFIGRCPQEGGNLEFVNDDQWFATEGETVSFRAVADQGYELDRVEVMNCRDLEDGSIEAIDGSYVTVTKNADGTYTFVMPDNGVQVFAFFKEKATAPICNPTWPTFGFGWNWGWNSMNHLYGMVQNAWNAFYNCYRYPAHMGWMGRNCGWGFFF